MADNPLDLNQAIPVLLAVLLNNPNLKPGTTPSGSNTGLYHSILNGSVLDEFVCVDRSDRARAIEWLTQRREQACDDAVRIAQQHRDPISVIAERDRTIDEMKAEIQRVRGCSVSAVASAVCAAFSSESRDESEASGAV